MSGLTLNEDYQSSDFRNRHRKLLRVRLIGIIFLSALSCLLHDYQFLHNLGLILQSLGIALFFNLLERFSLWKRKFGFFCFHFAMILDVIVLTLLIVSTEGRTPLLTLYILYVLAIGLFFGFRFSLPPAISGIFFFILCSVWLTPSSPWTYTNLINLIKDTGWLVILLGTVSIIALNHARSVWQKERTLTYRERELAAMQNISSATRKMLPLEGLVHLVLTELIYGLRFDFGFLLLLDPDNGFLRIYHARTGKYDEMIEKIFGFPLSSVYLSNLAVSNSFFRAIKRKRTILHYRLSELVVGLEPKISAERARKFQDLSGLKIFIGVPMIADRQVIGGLVAATKNEDIPKEQIVSLQKFANQVGLAIESAQRFEEIERKNVALEKANRAKSDFLATMSHELRTPLTAIIGFSELMLQDFMGAISGEQKDAVQEILNNAENLLVLINRILEFEKIEAGKSSLELENFSLDQTILSVENSTKSLIAQKSLHMEMQLDRDIPPMLADEKKVRQILLNLISNAIKFTPKNGKITLKTAHQNGKDGLFDHPGVIVSVTDTGIGIEGKNFEKIFNAFEQVDGTTTREYEGTGLGLALTKRFVEVQGGKIWVESEFGKGSCFSFFIPLKVQDRPH